MSNEGLHEDKDDISKETRDQHRALLSLQEELEAIDWYRQRADVCDNKQLKAILLHNMREEMEHAAMLTEWLLWGRPLRWLRHYFSATPQPRTYPARFPLFSLDRI